MVVVPAPPETPVQLNQRRIFLPSLDFLRSPIQWVPTPSRTDLLLPRRTETPLRYSSPYCLVWSGFVPLRHRTQESVPLALPRVVRVPFRTGGSRWTRDGREVGIGVAPGP